MRRQNMLDSMRLAFFSDIHDMLPITTKLMITPFDQIKNGSFASPNLDLQYFMLNIINILNNTSC